MEKFKKIIVAVLAFVFLTITVATIDFSPKDIVIGHKNYTEQRILGQLLAIYIEGNSDHKVKVREFGGTNIVLKALETKEIHVSSEYTGTAINIVLKSIAGDDLKKLYTDLAKSNGAEIYKKLSELENTETIFNHLKSSRDNKEIFEFVKVEYDRLFGIKWQGQLGFNNTFSIAIKNEYAKKYNINTISELIPHANKMNIIYGAEFSKREDGWLGLTKVYPGLDNFNKSITMDIGLRYTAIKNDDGQVMDAFTTDGRLKDYNLKVLEDDKNFFLPYYVSPIFNAEYLKDKPDVVELLSKLENKITYEDMQTMNNYVESKWRSPKAVATEFLISKGLIPKK